MKSKKHRGRIHCSIAAGYAVFFKKHECTLLPINLALRWAKWCRPEDQKFFITGTGTKFCFWTGLGPKFVSRRYRDPNQKVLLTGTKKGWSRIMYNLAWIFLKDSLYKCYLSVVFYLYKNLSFYSVISYLNFKTILSEKSIWHFDFHFICCCKRSTASLADQVAWIVRSKWTN